MSSFLIEFTDKQMNFSKHLKSGYKFEYENKLLKVKKIFKVKKNNWVNCFTTIMILAA